MDKHMKRKSPTSRLQHSLVRLAEIKYTNQARYEFLKKPVVEKYNKLYEKLTVKP